MAAKNGQVQNGTRMSALWGTGGKRGDGSRNSVLWGKGGRNASLMLVITAFVAMVVPWGASAHQATAKASQDASGSSNVFIPSSLLSQAQASPQTTFNVIVQGDGSKDAGHIASAPGRRFRRSGEPPADRRGSQGRRQPQAHAERCGELVEEGHTA